MKIHNFLIFFLFAAIALGARDFQTQFYAQLEKSDGLSMEKTLKDWKKEAPQDVEMQVAWGDYYCFKARMGGKKFAIKPAENSGFFLHQPRAIKITFRDAGEIRLEIKSAKQAAQDWKKALQSQPGRLDLYFALAGLFQNIGDFESQYNILGDGLEFVDKHPGNLFWVNQQKPPKHPSWWIPEAIQGYTLYYFGQRAPEKAFRLAKLSITFFPSHPDAYNSIALYYETKQDLQHALKYLIMAGRIAPRDSRILCNTGHALLLLNKINEAEIYYKKALALNNNEECAADARKQLEKLALCTQK